VLHNQVAEKTRLLGTDAVEVVAVELREWIDVD
jgi:hypothetical protein